LGWKALRLKAKHAGQIPYCQLGENARRLNLKNNLVYGTHFWVKRSLQFSVFEIRAHLNGIQTGYGFFLELAEVMILREETL